MCIWLYPSTVYVPTFVIRDVENGGAGKSGLGATLYKHWSTFAEHLKRTSENRETEVCNELRTILKRMVSLCLRFFFLNEVHESTLFNSHCSIAVALLMSLP